MPLFGIDISKYNGDLDFAAVKRAGVKFAMVKATQGHSLNGKHYLFEDPKFRRNIEGLSEVGIPIGAYHFLTASSRDECAKEAEYFLNIVSGFRGKITLYLAVDAERYNNPWLERLSRDELTDSIVQFCQIVERSGYTACHYTNSDHISNFVNIDKIEYPVWQAHYGKTVTKPLQCGDKLAIHQYTSSGILSCVPGKFDLNFGYAPLAKLIIHNECGLEQQTFDYIDKYKSGDYILMNIASKIVDKSLKEIKNPTTERLASTIKMHCGLLPDDISYMMAYKYADDLFRKIYLALLNKSERR